MSAAGTGKDTIHPVQAAPRAAGEWSQFKGDTEGRSVTCSVQRHAGEGGGRRKETGGRWGVGWGAELSAAFQSI